MGRMLSGPTLWYGQRSECADLSELLREILIKPTKTNRIFSFNVSIDISSAIFVYDSLSGFRYSADV